MRDAEEQCTVATSKFQRKYKQRASNPKVSRSFDLFHASAQCTKILNFHVDCFSIRWLYYKIKCLVESGLC